MERIKKQELLWMLIIWAYQDKRTTGDYFITKVCPLVKEESEEAWSSISSMINKGYVEVVEVNNQRIYSVNSKGRKRLSGSKLGHELKEYLDMESTSFLKKIVDSQQS